MGDSDHQLEFLLEASNAIGLPSAIPYRLAGTVEDALLPTLHVALLTKAWECAVGIARRFGADGAFPLSWSWLPFGATSFEIGFWMEAPEAVMTSIIASSSPVPKESTGRTPFHVLAVDKLGDCAFLVPELVRRGFDATVADRYGRTPLSLAAEEARLDLVEVLLANRVPVDGASAEDSPLCWAILADATAVVKALLKGGANVHAGRSPMVSVKSVLDEEIMLVDLGEMPLYLALLRGNWVAATLLLDSGADMKVVLSSLAQTGAWRTLSLIESAGLGVGRSSGSGGRSGRTI